jgi:hypothetical protein
LKSVEVNFPGKHIHIIWTALNHCGHWYKILLETIQNLYKSI